MITKIRTKLVIADSVKINRRKTKLSDINEFKSFTKFEFELFGVAR